MDEQTRQRVMIALVAFNLTVMIYASYTALSRSDPWSFGAFLGTAAIAIILGLVVGAVAFFVSALFG
jgi:FtsH-binding integral membrane protein